MSSSNTGGGSSKDNTAKATVADQIAQSVQSTANLLHLMQQTSPSQNQLIKLPKNLLEKTPTILNTGQVLQQMPQVISSLDAYMENGLQNGQHLKGAVQLLKSMENYQFSSLSRAQLSQKETEPAHQA